MKRKKKYLGDSVYLTSSQYGVELTTENGSGIPTNKIFLEEPVIISFLAQMDGLKDDVQKINNVIDILTQDQKTSLKNKGIDSEMLMIKLNGYFNL